jgi:hypothetical protein
VLLAMACCGCRRPPTHSIPDASVPSRESVTAMPPPDAAVLEWRQLQAHRFDCPVHHSRLREGVVPIRYGKGEEDEQIQDEHDGMPYAMTYVPGGCMVGEGDPQWARVFFCDRCRSEKARRAVQQGVEPDGRLRARRLTP